ncbi:unnamed protein product [Caenorhabditis sp. 36 PRJEB53466]|nr:unnamed protein product [Caenorhabditis sp. 36 PRJEB53466]
MRMSDDEDSLDFDITISGSLPSFGDPLTPPPTIRKSWYVKMQNRLATLAVFIFVLCIVVSIILVLANWHKM